MKKLMRYVRIVVIVIIVLETIMLVGCNTVNNPVDINSSYDAIKAAHVKNPSNSEISFIYDAINNKISGYPETVPDFINLPINCIIDAIETDDRINIEYTDDDNYQNGIIIAQDPKAGAAWGHGVIVSLTVNRKYNSINSKRSSMSLSLDKLYLLSGYYDSDVNMKGTIWADGEKLVDGDITMIYADNGNVYYNDNSAVNILNGERVLLVPGKDFLSVNKEKIYYRDQDNKIYCYNMNNKTNSLVYDQPVMSIYVNSDYIICYNPHDIFILDNKSYLIEKNIHSENTIIGCSLDNDNIYFAEMIFNSAMDQDSTITKYNIKQDRQIKIFDSKEMVGDIITIDEKIVFQHYMDNQIGIRYIDMRSMESKFFSIDDDVLNGDDDMIDILFDGQRIIYEKTDHTFYSICIFTGETKMLEFNN